MSELELWLTKATRCLSQTSAAQVRTEITEHYESARETAISNGAATDAAAQAALAALGDANGANRQYRQVLLTASEDRLLRSANREARAICSRPWIKWLLAGLLVASLPLATGLLLTGRTELAKDVLIVSVGMSPLPLALLLRIRTKLWGTVFRYLRAMAIVGALFLLFGHDALKWSWLIAACLWPLALNEWRRAELRRKLPLAAWPRHLYL